MLADRLQFQLPGSSGTTWNPSDKSANITLSGGNLVATSASTGINGVRSVFGTSTGKYYFEISLTALTSSGASSSSIGVSNTSFVFSSGFGSNNSTGWVLFAVSGSLGAIFSQTTVAVNNITSPAQGDIISVALDAGGSLFWSRSNGGIWNKNAAADPGTGVGGVSIGFAGPFYATVVPFTSADSFTANFGNTSFSYGVPAGFTAGFG